MRSREKRLLTFRYKKRWLPPIGSSQMVVSCNCYETSYHRCSLYTNPVENATGNWKNNWSKWSGIYVSWGNEPYRPKQIFCFRGEQNRSAKVWLHQAHEGYTICLYGAWIYLGQGDSEAVQNRHSLSLAAGWNPCSEPHDDCKLH